MATALLRPITFLLYLAVCTAESASNSDEIAPSRHGPWRNRAIVEEALAGAMYPPKRAPLVSSLGLFSLGEGKGLKLFYVLGSKRLIGLRGAFRHWVFSAFNKCSTALFSIFISSFSPRWRSPVLHQACKVPHALL